MLTRLALIACAFGLLQACSPTFGSTQPREVIVVPSQSAPIR
ncbi:hypothetical protein [Roseicella aquatilis]|nr:hypothetical protein [Roseicella aquatilis]